MYIFCSLLFNFCFKGNTQNWQWLWQMMVLTSVFFFLKIYFKCSTTFKTIFSMFTNFTPTIYSSFSSGFARTYRRVAESNLLDLMSTTHWPIEFLSVWEPCIQTWMWVVHKHKTGPSMRNVWLINLLFIDYILCFYGNAHKSF